MAIDGRSLRANKGMGFYQLLHAMGVFGPHAPSTIRAFGTRGQLSPAQLIDRYGIAHRPVRDVLVAYLQERQPMLDHTTLRELAFSLGALFWRDLERHHPGIASLHLAPEVAAVWKQRVLTKTRRVTGPDGQPSEVRERRAGALHNLAAVRAFYLDIAQWAMEDPARWGPWAAPCPIRAEDLARQKEIRSRKSRTDQRTRERLPVLPMLLSRVNDTRTTTAAALAAARATRPGESFPPGGRALRRAATIAEAAARIWGEDPDTGRRHDLTGEEDRAFWTWAAIETLRHTGIRIEELTELSHHSLIHYTLPSTGESVPLLQIAPSKTDTERLLVISPELADVLAAIITRIRGRDGALGCVASYDSHERVWNPPMPLLFQRRFGLEHRAIPAATIREWISGALDGANITDAAGQPLRFTPHDFRRLFITDAVLHGMPPHIAQLVAGHRDINTTMGYKAVYPDEVINGHRAFIARRRALRPSAEYRVPTEQEWEEFLGHFERRKLALGTCGRSYATPCIHEHACLRCPLLRPDPAHRARLVEIRDNLHARIAEARREGWLGEVDGLQISLTGARQKLAQLDGWGGSGEPISELLRPGKAGSNTAADHVIVLNAALAQLPAAWRQPDETGRIPVLLRSDATGASAQFAAHLAACGVEFSVGASFAHIDIYPALAGLPATAWTPAYQARKPRAAERAHEGDGPQITPRDGAWVAEATGLVDLSAWPPGTRLILRKERPHPGAQLRITDADGLRITGFLTNTAPGGPGRQLADLELRHRRHARVEDRVRAAKDTGLRNLPVHDMAQNRIWVAISALAQDLLAWCARLALPANAARWEPKRLRLRFLAVAGRLAHTARRRILHIDPNWPWAEAITTAHTRLAALAAP